MSDRDALLAAILVDPDEDTPRLVYADWLDENGEPDRAEFIRVQCRIPQLPPRSAEAKRLKSREATLSKKCFKHLAELPFAKLSFARGFVGSITSGLRVFGDHAEKLRPEDAPAFELSLDRDDRDEEAYPRDRIFEADPFEPVVARPELLRCVSLELPFLDEEPAELVLSCHNLASLRRFKAHGDFSGIFDDFNSPTFANLRRLELEDTHDNDSNPPEMRSLFNSPHLTNLEHLNLASCYLCDEQLHGFTTTSRFQRLRHLDISVSRFYKGLTDFFRTKSLPALEELNLSGSFRGYGGATEAEANEILTHLVDSPLFARLTSLSLRQNGIMDSGARILAASSQKVRLTRLDLSGSAISKTARLALDGRFGQGVCQF